MVLRRECSGATSSTTKVCDSQFISYRILPGLGRTLFSVKQDARNGVVSIFDMDNPRPETHSPTIPLQELGRASYSFSLDLVGSGNGPERAMQAAANANLWHRRLGHLNHKSLSLIKNLDNNDVCAVDKSLQLAHSKTANHKVKLPFQLVFVDLMGSSTAEALGGYTHISQRFPTSTPSGRSLIC